MLKDLVAVGAVKAGNAALIVQRADGADQGACNFAVRITPEGARSCPCVLAPVCTEAPPHKGGCH